MHGTCICLCQITKETFLKVFGKCPIKEKLHYKHFAIEFCMLLYSICVLLLSQGIQYQTWILCKRLTSKENKTDKQSHWSIKQSEEFRDSFSAICKRLQIFPYPAFSEVCVFFPQLLLTKFRLLYSFIHPRWPWLVYICVIRGENYQGWN